MAKREVDPKWLESPGAVDSMTTPDNPRDLYPTSPAALPSRELDAAVAREVMGFADLVMVGRSKAGPHDTPMFKVCPDPREIGEFGRCYDASGQRYYCGKPSRLHPCPQYSTDMRAMGTVLDALRERGWMYRLKFTGRDHQASIWRGADVVTEEADTLPRAVALAALAAVGGK